MSNYKMWGRIIKGNIKENLKVPIKEALKGMLKENCVWFEDYRSINCDVHFLLT